MGTNSPRKNSPVIAPRISWEELDAKLQSNIREYRSINSGIHIGLLGTNRGGKTTVATGGGNPDNGILRFWDDALVLDTSGDPGSISDYGKPVSRYRAIRGHQRLTVNDMSPSSREKVHRHINRAVRQGNIAIYADELRQLTEKKYLGLGATCDWLWLFAAKQNVSFIGATQAPRWIPGAFYDQSKVHFIFRTRDIRSKKRLAEISGDTDTIMSTMDTLERWAFMYVDIDGEVTVSKWEQRKTSKNEDANPYSKKKLVIYRAGNAPG